MQEGRAWKTLYGILIMYVCDGRMRKLVDRKANGGTICVNNSIKINARKRPTIYTYLHIIFMYICMFDVCHSLPLLL